jgi:hypothetical protein
MQPFLPKKSQPEPENKFSDCLYMKLEGLPVQPQNQDSIEFWRTSTKMQIDLHLTIRFNEQWESLSQGRVKFGLKGGELRVKLENSEIPYESRELTGSIKLSLQNERQKPEVRKAQKGRELRAIAINSSLNGSKPKAQANIDTVQKSSGTAQGQASVCQVTTKLSEENPAWVFEEEIGQPVLKGLLNQAKLATLNAIDLPCRVEATFEVSKRDVCLTDAEGLWPPDISRNKRAVLDRLIIQRLLEPKLKPYLSRSELHYD